MWKSREATLTLLFLVVVFLVVFLIIRGIRLKEDLSFLRIDLLETITEMKKCLQAGANLQDPSLLNSSEVFVCDNQSVTQATFPALKELSRHENDYQYISPNRCLVKEGCSKDDFYLNVGLNGKLLMSCEIESGECLFK